MVLNTRIMTTIATTVTITMPMTMGITIYVRKTTTTVYAPCAGYDPVGTGPAGAG